MKTGNFEIFIPTPSLRTGDLGVQGEWYGSVQERKSRRKMRRMIRRKGRGGGGKLCWRSMQQFL